MLMTFGNGRAIDDGEIYLTGVNRKFTKHTHSNQYIQTYIYRNIHTCVHLYVPENKDYVA